MQVVPESLITAAQNLAAIGSDVKIAHLEAVVPTTSIASAGLDEVSAAIAGAFASHGEEFQHLVGQATAFHDQFVQALTGSSNAFASAEAANAGGLASAAASVGGLATAAAAALPAEDNLLLTLIQVGAWILLIPVASFILAAYWAIRLLTGTL